MFLMKKLTPVLGWILCMTLAFNSYPLLAAKTKSVWQDSFTLETNKKYADAAKVLQPMLTSTPNNEFLLIRLGWLNYLQAKYNDSISFYKKALDLNADSIDARLGLTLPLMAQLRWKETAIYAKEVIAMSAWDYNAHVRLMTCESALLQWDILEKHAAEVAKRYPSDPSVFIFLARAQSYQSKKKQAIDNYKLALERSPLNAEALKYLKDNQ